MIDIFIKDVPDNFPDKTVDALDNALNTLLDQVPDFNETDKEQLEQLRGILYRAWRQQNGTGPRRDVITVDA